MTPHERLAVPAKPHAGRARVTVAVVTYRHAKYVEECLQSVVDQSERVDIIVVDDHSPDDTAATVKRFVEASRNPDQFTLLLHQQNIGLPSGLNAALRLTKTPYFVYLAGDDWSLPTRIQHQADAMDSAGPEVGLCYSDCWRAREDGSFHPERFSENHAQVWRTDTENAFRDLLLIDNWIPAPTVMFRTEALRAIGGFDESIPYEDHDSYVRIARSYKLLCIDQPLSVHRELEDCLGASIFRPNNPQWIGAQARIELKHLDHSDSNLTSKLAERVRVRAISLIKMNADSDFACTALMSAMRSRRQFDIVGFAYWTMAKAKSPRKSRAWRNWRTTR